MTLQSAAPGSALDSRLRASHVVSSPEELSGDSKRWTEDDFRDAIPIEVPQPSLPPSRDGPRRVEENWPVTYAPPHIGAAPFDAMCKIFFRRGGSNYVASGWIIQGTQGRKGILTAGHVVYGNGSWSRDYVVRRGYTGGHYLEEFRGRFARTLHGWINGQGMREFWDIGAIIPETPIPDTTPAIGPVWDYNPEVSPFNFYSDVGYPAKPANGYPFDGELQWVSGGPLIRVQRSGDQYALEAYNAMEQGSSGSPWLMHDPVHNIYHAAGLQSGGWDGIPSSFSPYFDSRNIVPLMRDIGILD
jgi:V8-like Glu-specific endopeptidase